MQRKCNEGAGAEPAPSNLTTNYRKRRAQSPKKAQNPKRLARSTYSKIRRFLPGAVFRRSRKPHPTKALCAAEGYTCAAPKRGAGHRTPEHRQGYTTQKEKPPFFLVVVVVVVVVGRRRRRRRRDSAVGNLTGLLLRGLWAALARYGVGSCVDYGLLLRGMGLVRARVWYRKSAKKCKKSAKKCKNICIYGFFFVPLHRIWE